MRASSKQAAIWLGGTEWRLLGSIVPDPRPCDDLLSIAIQTSADGRVLVGLAWDGCAIARAFRWEESTGMVNLGSTVEPAVHAGRMRSRATGRSSSASRKLTFGFWQGARWVDGTADACSPGPNWASSARRSTANHDGSLAVGPGVPSRRPAGSERVGVDRSGTACSALPVPRPKILSIEGDFLGRARATSDDGRVIGGAHAFGLESEAVIWLDKQPFYLKDYLRSHGVPDAFEGWVNTGTITDISRDGRVLVGSGAGPRDFKGYIVILDSVGGEE